MFPLDANSPIATPATPCLVSEETLMSTDVSSSEPPSVTA
jgi:hypothetical protein